MVSGLKVGRNTQLLAVTRKISNSSQNSGSVAGLSLRNSLVKDHINTQLAKNILSARLKKLVAYGIMEQVPASDGSAYQEYALTQKGRDLFPVIVALRQWGDGYLFSRGEKRLQVLDKRTGKPFRVEVQNAKGEILTANDLELVTVKN